ncbi:MAG: UDP-3-O-acyl-N-acetylglucosamine deacetylase [Elainellaceae cyanobacterium]
MYAVQQSTVAASIEQSGIGLHSGTVARVCIVPAEPNDGRYFVRTDLDPSRRIPARVDAVNQTVLSTELAVDDAQVQTVEHLLSALVGMGIDNARIEIDGAEVPLLDGSALGWVEAIARVGTVTQAAQRRFLTVKAPVWACQGDAFVAAFPADQPRFTYGIDFDLPAIGNQWFSWSPHQTPFSEAIAPARTFGLAHQIEHLRHRGLIKGGSLDNALVCGADGWLNPPLRFSNEPVRHKLLDLVGDLSLLGALPVAHILAYKASHSLHVQFNQSLANVFLFT